MSNPNGLASSAGPADIQNALFAALGPSGANVLQDRPDDTDSRVDVNDVVVVATDGTSTYQMSLANQNQTDDTSTLLDFNPGLAGLRRIARERGCRFPHLEKVIGKLSPRPLLMIHGGGDTYIKPDMAQMVFQSAREPKQFWLVEGAKHNQALHLIRDDYQRRVLEFFNEHLAEKPQPQTQPQPEPSPELAKTP